MHSLTPRQSPPTEPAEVEALLAAVDERIAAIDERLAEIRQRLQTLDRSLAAPAQPASGELLAERLGNWLTGLDRPSPAPRLGAASQGAPWLS